jgi:hypothetical protein
MPAISIAILYFRCYIFYIYNFKRRIYNRSLA